jgi:Ni/Fe-hydrogenase subunit HybB-like protein
MKMLKEIIGPLTFWKTVMFILIGFMIYSGIYRFYYGLGAATNLSDTFPWGIWIGFDLLSGVALAAGGFTITAVVYIFNIKKFKPIIRPAVLTAFLGYILAVSGLIFDLGRPDRIWHPIIMWNPRSVMFEVAWCVILYNIVLFLEFSPALFEKLRLRRPLQIIKSITIPLVILGVILSTLHQSSLGSLYLIVPNLLHELWYTPLLPVLFFISAVAVGLAMVTFESFLSKRAFNKHLELELLIPMARVLAIVLLVYGLLRVYDMIGSGAIASVFTLSTESMLFLVEIFIGVVIPMSLLFMKRFRTSERSLFWISFMVVIGVVLNRMNVTVTGIQASIATETYFPSWMEISVSMGLVATGFGVFALVVKYLPIFEHHGEPMPLTDAQKIEQRQDFSDGTIKITS